MIQEAYVQGISTRSVDDLVKAMGMRGVSKRRVSRLCGELDEQVGAFLNRQIEGDWPYLWIDATYVKTREAGRIVSVAVIIAGGVNTEGQREVLGMKVGASEAEPFWTDFLRSLNRRGLRGVKLVISDSHEGVKAAVAKPSRVIHHSDQGSQPSVAFGQRCKLMGVRPSMGSVGDADDNAMAERFFASHPDGHFKFPHLWPVKLLHAGRADYEASAVTAMRAAASLRR